MTSALVYARYSEKPDASEAQTLVIQEQVAREYAQRAGLTILDVLADPEVSGRKRLLENRPSGAQLVARVGRGKVENVIVYRLDRIFRNAVDGLITLRRWRKEGVRLHIATSGAIIDLGTADGFLHVGMSLLFAEYEALTIATRTKDSMKRQQAAGRSMGGVAPYGWSRVEDETRSTPARKKYKLVEDEYEQLIIRRIIEQRERGATYARIVRDLKMDGIRARRNWNRASIVRILRDAKGRHSNASL